MPAGTPGSPGAGTQTQEKFEIRVDQQGEYNQLQAAMRSEIASAFKSAKSAEQAGHGAADAVHKFVEGIVGLLQKEVPPGTGGPGGAGTP